MIDSGVVRVNGYQPIHDLYQEICTAQAAGAVLAALAMVYVGISTMAWLSLPIGSDEVQRKHFCVWVDAYLKAGDDAPYQYRSIDLYAARCALLHGYGSLATLHRNSSPPPETFGYLDSGPHQTDGTSFVLISIATLARDFGQAVTRFFLAAQHDKDLKARIDSRIDALMTTWSYKSS